MPIKKSVVNLFLSFIVLGLTACAGPRVYQVDLLPAPEIYSEGIVNPFPEQLPLELAPYKGILYVTDRLPAEKRHNEIYYRNKRGTLLRMGTGEIEIEKLNFLKKQEARWDEVRRISLEKNRSSSYPLQIKNIREIGILDRTYNMFIEKSLREKKSKEPARKFASLVNKKLAISKKKDIYIYVHGYNTVFEDPLLVASELWHYMAYDGVFIAYSWPATPRGLAYLADLDTAKLASRNLRIFLEYLSEKTTADNIHLIGYSMGTRVVTYALQDIALINKDKGRGKIRKNVRIGNVMLIGSDLDRGVFAGFLLDGFLDVSKSFTIYMSDTDSALGASRWLFERYRLGEAWVSKKAPDILKAYLDKTPKLRFIDVTKAEHAATGNGHHYFTDSPWVSSDLLLTLLYDLTPEQRGLVRNSARMWEFSPDYLHRVRSSIQKLNIK